MHGTTSLITHTVLFLVSERSHNTSYPTVSDFALILFENCPRKTRTVNEKQNNVIVFTAYLTKRK